MKEGENNGMCFLAGVVVTLLIEIIIYLLIK